MFERSLLSARLLLIALFLASSSAWSASPSGDDDTVWVRVFQAGQLGARGQQLLAEHALQSYGEMLFGQLDRVTAQALRNQGLSISISDNPFKLTLGEEVFDPVARIPRQDTAQQGSQAAWHLVQFEGPVRPEWLSALRQQGARIAQPIYPFSYVVWLEPSEINRVSQIDSVRWMGPWQADWAVLPQQRDYDEQVRPTMALASAHADLRSLHQLLGELGTVQSITDFNAHFRLVHIDLPGNRYRDMAALPEIYTVQWIPPETAQRGEMSNQSVVGNYDDNGVVFPGYLAWLNETGYDGSGITVGVVDGRVRVTHVDLVDRMAPCTGTNGSCGGTGSDGHGTHVAGAIAGTGASGTTLGGFLRGQGVAPGASLVTQRYVPFLGAGPGSMVPNGMLQIFQDSARSGALLTNNSWGPSTTPQGYNIPTQQIDFISRDADPSTPGDQPILAVWSIMNGNGDSGGACAPSSLGAPDEAKNLFAVGSTSLQTSGGAQVGNIFRVSPNSAHGNACDGRLVPHIVAPGCSTDSTVNSSDSAHAVAGYCGTSMASPIVSGAVAVWAEKYIAQFGVNPSPALAKAVFTAAAQNLQGNPNADGGTMGHRPDRFQGYGRLDLDLVMNHGLEVFLFDQQEVFTEVGQEWGISVVAVDPDEPIRIMLAWTDAPGHGAGGSTPAWVNNLDLSVNVQGLTYFGNNIGSDGWSQSGGLPDSRNNLEGVFLSPAQHGGQSIDLLVSVADLAGDALNPWNPGNPSQDFALACYNCLIGDPTFSLGMTSTAAEACAAEGQVFDIVRQINVAAIGPFSGLISFGVETLPTGVSSLTDPLELEAPAQLTWTISVDETAAAGEYEVKLQGSSGEIERDLSLALSIFEPLISGPALQHPANLAADLVLRPVFSWQGLEGANGYRIQIADDEDFSTIVLDSSQEETSFRSDSELEKNQVYYWRVSGENLCGDGEWSEVRSFSTRLDPISSLSEDAFSFSIAPGSAASQTLGLSNTGTGNLTFHVTTDQQGAGRDGHSVELDEVLEVENFTLPGQGSYQTSAFAGNQSRGRVVGFTFRGSVTGISGTDSWASDLVLTLTSPGGESYSVGGYQTGNPPWEFNGSGSTNDGTYSSMHIGPEIFGEDGADDLGEWEISFGHTWNATMNWSAVTITLHKLPLPFCRQDVTPADWLTASPASGSVGEGGTIDISIQVDSSGLVPGDYRAYLCVATNDPDAELVAVPIDLIVDPLAEPAVQVIPAELAQFVLPNEQAATSMSIANVGGAPLDWSLSSAEPDSNYGQRVDRQTLQPLALPQGSSRAGNRAIIGEYQPLIRGVQGLPALSGSWSEDFDDLATLPDSGWVLDNRSQPLGPTGWFHGNPEEFSAQAGADDSYIAANYLNTIEDGTGTISNWLISPEIVLNNGTEIRFWTRTVEESIGFEDRLQVRLSSAGSSSDVGNTATSVGDFDTLLLDINPTYTDGGFPREWTEYSLVIEGLSESATGRIAFRYFVEDAGGQGSNGDYIGIDSFSVTQPNLEGCDAPVSLSWLGFTPDSGQTAPGSSSAVTLTFDADGLAEGIYQGLLCLESNDPANPLIEIPVLMNVGEDEVFSDRFEQ